MTQICTPALLLTSQAEMLVSLYIGVFLAHFCSRMLTAVFEIQKKFIFDSSLCLNFYTQHQFWRGEKMNLCLWMINCLKVGLIMAAVKEFHLYQPQYDNINIFLGQKSDNRREVKNQQYLSLRCSPSKTNYCSCSSGGCEDAFVTPEFPCGTWIGHQRQNRWKDIIQPTSVDLQMLICARTFTLWDPFLLVQCTLWWKQGNLRTSLSGNH